MSLAYSCVFFQTLTAERMKTGYDFGSLKVLRQTEQVTCLVRFLKRTPLSAFDKIACKHCLKELLFEIPRKYSLRVAAR